jgi:hypothetical protein
MEAIVSGWLEIGARNHIVVKNIFVLFIFFGKKSGSHKTIDKNNPKIKTAGVKSFIILGKMNGCGENSKKIPCKITPAIIAVIVRILVDQLINGSLSVFACSGQFFILPHKEQKESRRE